MKIKIKPQRIYFVKTNSLKSQLLYKLIIESSLLKVI